MRPEHIRQAQGACVSALAGFNRLSAHGTASPLSAYALRLSLARRDRDHDRESFRSFAADLLLGASFLLKHDNFLYK
jgi:hypothetical protein